jgi:hypothetical protein
MGRVSQKASDLEAAQLATCAQVECWVNSDESMSILGGFSSIGIGSFSASFAGGSSGAKGCCSRALAYLQNQGLLYRGVKTREDSDVFNDSDLHN